MSTTELSRKIDDLASWLMILRVPPGIVGAERIAEASAKAAALARELFPPSAKPLEWEFFDGCWISGPYKIDKNRWTFDNSETHITPVQNGFYIDIAAQKAACESHHQARFQELLA